MFGTETTSIIVIPVHTVFTHEHNYGESIVRKVL